MGSGIRILLLYFCRGKTSSYQHNDEGNKEENVGTFIKDYYR